MTAVLLPATNTLQVWLKEILAYVIEHASTFRDHEMEDRTLQRHKGLVVLQYVGNRIATFLGKQAQTA